MSDKNVCPYCGCDVIIAGTDEDGEFSFGHCCRCHAEGPLLDIPDGAEPDVVAEIEADAIRVFASLHTYNPATHVVVSREAARRIADTWFVDSPFSSTNDDAALAELRAAMEATHERDE